MIKVNFRFIIFFFMLNSCANFYYDGDNYLKQGQNYNAKVRSLIEYKGWVYINDSIALDGYNLEYKEFRYVCDVLELKDSISVNGNHEKLYIFKPNGEVYTYLKRTYPRE